MSFDFIRTLPSRRRVAALAAGLAATLIACPITASAQTQTSADAYRVAPAEMAFSRRAIADPALLASLRSASGAKASDAGAAAPEKTCYGRICPLADVQASALPGRVWSNQIVANPLVRRNLIATGNDWNCDISYHATYASTDAGATWARSCLGTQPGHTGLAGQTAAFDSRGVAYAASIDTPNYGRTSEIVIQRSGDLGAHWSPARRVVTNTLGALASRPLLEIDANPGSPRRDTLYLAATQVSPLSDTQITVSRSTDGGTHWQTTNASARFALPEIVQFADLAVGRDGTVHLAYMKCTMGGEFGRCGGTEAEMRLQTSTDGGATWSPPVTMATAVLAPGNCGQMYGCLPVTDTYVGNTPSIAIDTSGGAEDGRLYGTFYDMQDGVLRVVVVSSADGGRTWGAKRRLETEAVSGDQFLPWISVSPRGEVGVTWLDRRDDPEDRLYEAFGSRSTDGGQTFKRSVRISSAASDPTAYTEFFSIGDFAGNAWSGDTLYMAFVDTRTGIQQAWVGGTTRR